MKILNIKTKMKNEKLTKNFVRFTVLGKPHHKGITLMSLVITIVILLILGGAAVGIIVNENGFFDKTQNITNRWNDRISAEEQAIQNALASRNKTTGETIIPILGSITLEPSNLALEIEEGENAEATIIATLNNISGTVSWTSSEPTVAIVDNNGKVTTVGAGTTIITASCGEYSATCSVSVTTKTTPKVTLSATTGEIEEEKTLVLTASLNVTPTQNIVWTSSDDTIATVVGSGTNNTTGTITGIKAGGPVTITATYGDKTATCSVTVTPAMISFTIDGMKYSCEKYNNGKLTDWEYWCNSSHNTLGAIINADYYVNIDDFLVKDSFTGNWVVSSDELIEGRDYILEAGDYEDSPYA